MSQQTTAETPSPQDFFFSWMKTTLDFWQQMARLMPGGMETDDSRIPESFRRAHHSYESANHIFQSVFTRLMDPENFTSFLHTLEEKPDFLLNMSRNIWESYQELQKKWLEDAAKFGDMKEAYHRPLPDREMFDTFRKLYEKELAKFFNVPQLGLTRFYQERINQLADEFVKYRTTLSEFIYMFFTPLEQASADMQQKIEEMTAEGDIRADFKDYYTMWVQNLEKHYEHQLRSPEFKETLRRTVEALRRYNQAKEEVMCDFLKPFPVPTNEEMDELYKELYELKKTVKSLVRKVE